MEYGTYIKYIFVADFIEALNIALLIYLCRCVQGREPAAAD